MKTVLFLCTGNAARSQMAEGLVNARLGREWRAASAGVAPKGLDPQAVRAMSEIGIDISGHRSKPLGEFIGRPFDLVVTLCDDAAEHCPVWPGAARKMHLPFDDPGRVRAQGGGEAEVLAVMRRVRDEMLQQLPEALRQPERTVGP
jgi:arsenate reductase